MPAAQIYASFLVRLWCEGGSARQTPVADWKGEVEHIQTRKHWTFGSLDELLSLLQRQMEEVGAGEWR